MEVFLCLPTIDHSKMERTMVQFEPVDLTGLIVFTATQGCTKLLVLIQNNATTTKPWNLHSRTLNS
jgi:hypothetical protein